MFFTATFQYLLSCNTRHGRGFRTVECICKGIVKYKACDFPRVIQAIRMQKKKKKGHMSVENSYTSKCMSTKNWQQSRNWILRPTEEAEQLVSIVQIMKIIQVLLLLMPGVNLYYLKLATLSTQMNCCKSIQLNEYVASSELGSNPLILKFWLKKCCI